MAKYDVRGPQSGTLATLLAAGILSRRTRKAAEVLLRYDDLAFERRVPDTSVLDALGEKGRYAAE